ncbi:MAG: polyphosphate kinase 2 [Ancylobacter novellus]|uniref:ADP/GDP-polyphosphate phosphotransferase n=1 Tax=Ancylobacter novellus TaxID=921 RepID=A0A2W5KAU7_ANCNO|nr:MAG: polyphosphate kinase 2 [Ancylobacter novellus]
MTQKDAEANLAAAAKAIDPTDVVAPEGMNDAPPVHIDGITMDLDDLELPKEIVKAAFKSGGYPYDQKLDAKEGDAALVPLQIELLKLQAWAKKEGERIVLLFEGRDAAGKGGTIDRITEHLNPRSVRVEALSKPTAEEASQWYFQRYLRRMPAGGEIVLFDRSWYNRAGVEPVMGFCTPAQTAKFLADAPVVERLLVEDGVRLFKFWLTVGREEQISRLHERRHDPLKRWKLSPIDYAGLNLWDAYSDAADKMLRATHTDAAPWTVVKSNDKRRLRLAVIRHILLNVPYKGRDLAAVGGNDSRLIMDAGTFLADGGEK